MTCIEKHGNGGLERREEIRAMPRYALTKRERRTTTTTPRGLEFMLLNRARLYRISVQTRGWSKDRARWIAGAREAIADSAAFRGANAL